MIVYRVEKTGTRHSETGIPVGPYHGFFPGEIFLSHHPEPIKDGCQLGGREWAFGFRDIESLIAWFGHEFDRLDEFGYSMGVYTVPDGHVSVGKNQVAFNTEVCEQIDLKSLLDLTPC